MLLIIRLVFSDLFNFLSFLFCQFVHSLVSCSLSVALFTSAFRSSSFYIFVAPFHSFVWFSHLLFIPCYFFLLLVSLFTFSTIFPFLLVDFPCLSFSIYLFLPSHPSTVFNLPLRFPLSLCNFSSILSYFPQDCSSSRSLSISHSLFLLVLSLFLIFKTKKEKKKRKLFSGCSSLRFKTQISFLSLFFFFFFYRL